ncbi:MAG: DinB family protein [Bryobacteraceae bacterium]
MSTPEPWLRGPLPNVDPVIAPLLRALEQACEDLSIHTADLTVEQVWARPHGLAPLGFHLRHIAASVDRLATYASGRQLNESQLASLQAEMEPGDTVQELLTAVDQSFREVRQQFLGIDPATFAEPRGVGRKQLPTTVIGLAIHIAEHTARHLGQAISAAKLARAAAGA